MSDTLRHLLLFLVGIPFGVLLYLLVEGLMQRRQQRERGDE